MSSTCWLCSTSEVPQLKGQSSKSRNQILYMADVLIVCWSAAKQISSGLYLTGVYDNILRYALSFPYLPFPCPFPINVSRSSSLFPSAPPAFLLHSHFPISIPTLSVLFPLALLLAYPKPPTPSPLYVLYVLLWQSPRNNFSAVVAAASLCYSAVVIIS